MFKSTIKAILQLPPLVQLRRLRYERQFRGIRAGHLFRGVFPSFDEAARSAPASTPVGYDHDAPAGMYQDRPIFSEDYAVLFWLARVLGPGQRVFDHGGHAGSAFDAWVRVLPLPAGVTWQIHDVAAVCAEGRRRNEQRIGTKPAFTTDFADASGADVLLASGSLQYIAQPLAERLASLPRKPRHLLLNQLPVHPREQYVTLQNIRTCFCPYVVFHDDAFFASLRALGYTLRHRWENPAKSCHVPTYPRHTAAPYVGALLELAAPTGSDAARAH
jgi:putative methyltransferase (TIGR04325 family)